MYKCQNINVAFLDYHGGLFFVCVWCLQWNLSGGGGEVSSLREDFTGVFFFQRRTSSRGSPFFFRTTI